MPAGCWISLHNCPSYLQNCKRYSLPWGPCQELIYLWCGLFQQRIHILGQHFQQLGSLVIKFSRTQEKYYSSVHFTSKKYNKSKRTHELHHLDDISLIALKMTCRIEDRDSAPVMYKRYKKLTPEEYLLSILAILTV